MAQDIVHLMKYCILHCSWYNYWYAVHPVGQSCRAVPFCSWSLRDMSCGSSIWVFSISKRGASFNHGDLRMLTALFVLLTWNLTVEKGTNNEQQPFPCIHDAFARYEWIMINNKCVRKTIKVWIEFLNSTNCSQCLSLSGRVVALCFTQLSTPESYHSFITITQLAEDLPNGFVWSICWDYEWICEMQISQCEWWCKFCFKKAKRCHILQSN